MLKGILTDVGKNTSEQNNVNNFGKISSGLYLAGLTGGAAILLSVIAVPFISPALRKICLPYVPATDEQVRNVLKALHGKRGKIIDLGSGDGRIVIAAAKEKKLHATGVELNPWLVLYSRINSWRKGCLKNTAFMHQNLWNVNLSKYENIVIFGVEEMMEDLQKKLDYEVGSHSCVIACRFPLPSWTPIATFGEGLDTVWLYEKPSVK